MIKIIVVDSDKISGDKIKKIISGVSINYDLEVIVELYTKFCPKLKCEIENIEYKKIYILEIDLLSDISGIKIAEMIRVEDWDSEIIFVTNHDKMFETVFRTIPDVFNFIEKFHNFEEKLSFDIERIFKKNFDYNMFKYKARNVSIRIYYRSILYIYRDTVTRKLVIVTNSNTYSLNIGLTEIMELLDKRFLIVHRACIVNLEAVSTFDWNGNSFVLENGESVNLLSKKYKAEVEKIIK